MAAPNGDGVEAGWTRAPQRPRAGTMPSTFHLAVGSGASTPSSRAADPLAPSPDGLLAPALGLSARPSLLLGRRLSGNPLVSTSASAASGNDSNAVQSSSVFTPSSLSNLSALTASSQALPVPLEGSARMPTGNTLSTSLASASSTSPPTSSLKPPSSASSISPSAIPNNGSVSPLELRASLLKSSQPVSPDPVAAARLRSGSLTLPPSGLGNGFRPGFYGPPGSGTGTWTPRSTGMGTPLAMPTSSVMIPEEHLSSGRGNSNEPLSPAEDSYHHVPPTAIGGILDFLDNDESTLPSTASTSGQLNHPPSRSVGSITPRHTSPTSARTGSTSSSSLLSAGTRPHAASLSNPSSAHPSVHNLRQAYNEHSSSSSLMQHSASATSAPDAALPLSPRSAARLRANTVAADPPIIRRSSPYYLSPSMAGSNMNGFSSSPRSSYDNAIGLDGISNHLVSLKLNDQQGDLQERAYDGSYASSATANYHLLNANRPRASTIGILDEANAMTPNRRRAGTTGPNMLPSGLRTPVYGGDDEGYLGAGAVLEGDEEVSLTDISIPVDVTY
jgi:hypothetical protein